MLPKAAKGKEATATIIRFYRTSEAQQACRTMNDQQHNRTLTTSDKSDKTDNDKTDKSE
jgi:hypothetical protein